MHALYFAIFTIAFLALVALDILLLATVFSTSFKLWPTPAQRSWQHYTFWPLFRGGLGLTLLYALLTVQAPLAGEAVRFYAGLVMVVIGFGFTIYGYFDLGLDNTYGADEGLVTSGLYRYSRNPQYVASIMGFSGVALAHGATDVIILCALADLLYIVLPFTEEPWLRKAYGPAYDAYARRVPRFL
jgi:protein-S-isoprenylcysteine O-methyltransferase Ste14